MSFSFNSLETARSNSGSSIISAGPHRLSVERIELKQTNARTGQYYNCLIRSLETNETSFYMFNMSNPSVKAQEIGRAEFSSMFCACGLTGDITEFTAENVKGRFFMADVYVKHDSMGEKNAFKNWRPVAESVGGDEDVPF